MTTKDTAQAEQVVERLSDAVVECMDVVTVAIGDRLGYYHALDGPQMTAEELAEATGTHRRYAREWLEAQAMSGYLTYDDGRYTLAPGVAEVLARPGTSLWQAPLARQVTAAGAAWTRIADGAVSGRGHGWGEYGEDMYQAQSDRNAAPFMEMLADTWLRAALPDLHARMDAGEHLRVADIGCGGGWAAIALAKRFEAVAVDGYDVDRPTLALARQNAEASGVADRVRFHDHDVAADPPTEQYDLVMAFECLHDMPHPVDVLGGVRGMVRPDGRVLVGDMAGAAEFDPDGDPLQRLLYGFSVLVCLPDAMSGGDPDNATGTVIRPARMDSFARDAGFAAAVPLDVEHDVWRFYELTR